LLDSTFTVDEVEDILSDVASEVTTEVESELINSSHTNVLMLQQARTYLCSGDRCYDFLNLFAKKNRRKIWRF
jgi:hypothetical protein